MYSHSSKIHQQQWQRKILTTFSRSAPLLTNGRRSGQISMMQFWWESLADSNCTSGLKLQTTVSIEIKKTINHFSLLIDMTENPWHHIGDALDWRYTRQHRFQLFLYFQHICWYLEHNTLVLQDLNKKIMN